MKRFFIMLVAATFSAAALSACNGANASNENNTDKIVATSEAAETETPAQVEVIYFHGKQRCMTCMAIEKETKALMEGELAEMVKSGKVKMRVVDFSTNEGKSVASKYKVSFSSLFVVNNPGTNETAEDLTRFAFANARNNAEGFRKELRAKVLAGMN